MTAARLTVKQAAALMNVSERSVYMARRVRREAPDLSAEVAAGQLTVHAAIREIERRQGRVGSPANLQVLKAAWGRASPSDRAAFVAWTGGAP